MSDFLRHIGFINTIDFNENEFFVEKKKDEAEY